MLVDDEKDIVDLMEEVLHQDGFLNIQKEYTGLEALQICKEFQPDVIVLDVMLPEIDGIEVCKKIREFLLCSILFLSSKNDDIDKILGLSSSGDDYITKPFSSQEIVFQIKAQLRRQQYQTILQPNKNNIVVADLLFDKENTIMVHIRHLFVIIIHMPADSIKTSDYSMKFTKELKKQIIYIENTPKIKQSGIELLQSNQTGIQILDDRRQELVSY